MKVVVLGAGFVGQAVAYLLSKTSGFEDISLVDINEENLRHAKKICGGKIRTLKVDILKNIGIVEGSDIVSCALPGSISFDVCKKILELGISIVDSSFYPQDAFELDIVAKDNSATYVPDAGFAPGISNILVGYMVSEVGEAGSVEIYVGGLPVKPEGPFLHLVNWSLSDFVDEYVRPARIIRNGKQVYVDPLDDIQRVEIERGIFDAFYTDGLRTLLRTINVGDMFEKTLRYPGHLERMRFLRDIGLLSNKVLSINGVAIASRKILLEILRKYAYRPDMRDRVILYIKVRSRKGGRTMEAYFEDHFDERLGLSAMAKTTGFTNAILVEALGEVIRERGVYPPEFIGMKHVDYFMKNFVGVEKLKIRMG